MNSNSNSNSIKNASSSQPWTAPNCSVKQLLYVFSPCVWFLIRFVYLQITVSYRFDLLFDFTYIKSLVIFDISFHRSHMRVVRHFTLRQSAYFKRRLPLHLLSVGNINRSWSLPIFYKRWFLGSCPTVERLCEHRQLSLFMKIIKIHNVEATSTIFSFIRYHVKLKKVNILWGKCCFLFRIPYPAKLKALCIYIYIYIYICK